jgi:hypothetical protein
MNRIDVIESGLKCDNPECDWKDGTILYEDYENHVNSPCPKCGENILTEEDFKNVVTLRSTMDLLNSMPQEELDELTKLMEAEGSFGELLKEFNENDLLSMTIDTHKGLNITDIKKVDNTMKNLSFEKDPDNRWYVILPEWKEDRAALEMVAGADTLLDIIAQGRDLVHLNICTSDFSTAVYHLTKLEETDDVGGAIYEAKNIHIESMTPFNLWLCDVTRFVYGGEMPQNLYFSN